MNGMAARRTGALALVIGAALLLAGCLLVPGKFSASLDLRRDGSFTYRYDGEMVMLGLTQLAQASREATAPFKPAPCLADEDQGKSHPCSSTEIDAQRRAWETRRAAQAERQKRETDQAKALFGGIDPTDPQSAEQLAERLRHQAGWRSVAYKGNGVFMVSFALSGRLTHDFAFPTIERIPLANSFVTLSRRADGSVRVDAPGFGGGRQGGAGMVPMQLMLGAINQASDKNGTAIPGLPPTDGRFTLTTDAPILANNTEDGPRPDSAGQRLDWTVNAQSAAAPMALVRLAP